VQIHPPRRSCSIRNNDLSNAATFSPTSVQFKRKISDAFPL
jgi:hypothetical protein